MPRIGRMIKRLGVCRANGVRMLFFCDTSSAPCSMNYPARYLSYHPKAILPFLAVFTGLTISLAATNRARATGGPENVLLVVNPLSPDSMCIANHYAELRHIPPNNFLFLRWDPHQENTDIDTFRERILFPVLQIAQLPIPGRRIDYVIYSSDFPWGIRIDADIKKFKDSLEKQEQGKKEEKPAAKPPAWTTYATPVASINGLTYLWEPVKYNSFYVHPQCNWYARTGALEQA